MSSPIAPGVWQISGRRDAGAVPGWCLGNLSAGGRSKQFGGAVGVFRDEGRVAGRLMLLEVAESEADETAG